VARPRVLVTRRWPEEVERQLAERFDVTFNEADVPLGRAALEAAMGKYDVVCPILSDRLDAEVIGAGDRVKLIANYGVGFEHIDIEAARARGIVVTNTPGALTDATAELALTLILMAARRTGEGERVLRAERWPGWGPTDLLGTALTGKTLGVVGFGRIGIATARKAHHGLGMKIAYYGRRECLPDVARELETQFYPDLHELLAVSDVVSLHTPGGAETANLIDARALTAMKAGSYLINTARGGIVDHAALAEALRRGHLAGAGLDVFPAEPNVPEELLGLENVVLLPHMGSATREARVAMGERALANMVAWAEGRLLPDRVA
jgi:lactate dehydrogenase-like 2-hydroxyacid dehydrogenase